MPISYVKNGPIGWRINVIISSRDLARVMRPVVYLEFQTEDGVLKCIEIPVGKFHLLRQNVALILKEMELYNGNKINT